MQISLSRHALRPLLLPLLLSVIGNAQAMPDTIPKYPDKKECEFFGKRKGMRCQARGAPQRATFRQPKTTEYFGRVLGIKKHRTSHPKSYVINGNCSEISSAFMFMARCA